MNDTKKSIPKSRVLLRRTRLLKKAERIPPFHEPWAVEEGIVPGGKWTNTRILTRCPSLRSASMAAMLLATRCAPGQPTRDDPFPVGSLVVVQRGSQTRTEGPGRKRGVHARYLDTVGPNLVCQLLEDDPDDTVGWKKAGDIGNWSRCAVTTSALQTLQTSLPSVQSLKTPLLQKGQSIDIHRGPVLSSDIVVEQRASDPKRERSKKGI